MARVNPSGHSTGKTKSYPQKINLKKAVAPQRHREHRGKSKEYRVYPPRLLGESELTVNYLI